jgi:hypothetical protein
MFFWVFPQRQIVVGRRLGTLYQFHLQRLDVDTVYIQPLKMELIQGSEMSANYNLTPGKYPKEHIQYGRDVHSFAMLNSIDWLLLQTSSLHCVTSQKSKNLNYTVAEA